MCHALALKLARYSSSTQAIMDKLISFLKWADWYGWDPDDPFQRKTRDFIREMQDEALVPLVEERGKPAP